MERCELRAGLRRFTEGDIFGLLESLWVGAAVSVECKSAGSDCGMILQESDQFLLLEERRPKD